MMTIVIFGRSIPLMDENICRAWH